MLKNTRRPPQDIVLNGISALGGLSLLLAPPLLGFTDTPIAAWNSWVIGAAILAVAGAALVALKEWEEWTSLVLGAWTLVSPWILGFSAVQGAAVLHVLIGLTVIAVAAVELWSERNRPMTTA